MSKINGATITGVTEYQADSATMGNVIVLTASKAGGLTITDPKLEVFVQNPNGADLKRIADITSVIGLAELKALNKESIIRTVNSVTVGALVADPATSVLTDVEYKFDISGILGIFLNEQDRVRIRLSGLDAGAEYELYHEETRQGGKGYKNYKIVGTDSTPNVKFFFTKEEAGSMVTAFAIKKGNNFKGIEVKFKNSTQTIPMLPEEIEMRTREIKGYVYENQYEEVGTGRKWTQMESNNQQYYTIPVHDIEYIQVNTDGTNVETITEREKSH